MKTLWKKVARFDEIRGRWRFVPKCVAADVELSIKLESPIAILVVCGFRMRRDDGEQTLISKKGFYSKQA